MRNHFKHSVELVDRKGDIVDVLAAVEDFLLAQATYQAARQRWPKERIRLSQQTRIVEDSSDPENYVAFLIAEPQFLRLLPHLVLVPAQEARRFRHRPAGSSSFLRSLISASDQGSPKRGRGWACRPIGPCRRGCSSREG